MKKSIALTLAAAALAVSAVAQAERTGEELYSTKCFVCHAAGVAGAPKLGDKEAWGPRMAAGTEALLASAKSGKNAMPPMGTCMDCTDAELTGAIEYMLSKVQ